MSAPVAESLTSLDQLAAAGPAVDLDDLNRAAALQTRIDRKYVLAADDARAVLATATDGLLVLEIDGQRSFAYENTYFDTPDRVSYRGAATRRPDRFKVRLRRYPSGDTFVEVKIRTPRGVTVKHRRLHDAGESLTPADRQLVDELLTPQLGNALQATVETTYRRLTLFDPRSTSRATIDQDLAGALPGGDPVALTDWVVLETKTLGGPSDLDRALWRAGHRPVPISKFAVATVMLTPGLPANRWHRVLARAFGWSPEHQPGLTWAAR